MFAAQNSHTESLEMLIEHGANLDLQDNDGLSACMLTASRRDVDGLMLLIEAYCSSYDYKLQLTLEELSGS